jgi:hypothetical protein
MKNLILSTTLLLSVFVVSAKDINLKKDRITYKTVCLTNVGAFCKLIQLGDFDAVKALIEEGEDVNKKSTGLTPLMFAARYNKAEIAKLLVENGANLKLKSDRKGFTALKWAELSNAKDAYEVISNAIAKQKNNKKRKKKQ